MLKGAKIIPLSILKKYPETECSCLICKSMCDSPCWPTPQEAGKLLDAGLAKKLMLNWWVDYPNNIYVLCGANPGYEGKLADEGSWLDSLLSGGGPLRSGCSFQTEIGKCQLHSKHLKPVEGRRSHHDGPHGYQLRRSIAATWNTLAGKKVVERWKKLVKFTD